ncbi:hypothetical protein BY996DRAFT_6464550 [Phakopsora pachyrhizi]|nr:hypothetical protein BY996DRAFT_6464550 [Phakopsora pachyrhizi]
MPGSSQNPTRPDQACQGPRKLDQACQDPIRTKAGYIEPARTQQGQTKPAMVQPGQKEKNNLYLKANYKESRGISKDILERVKSHKQQPRADGRENK